MSEILIFDNNGTDSKWGKHDNVRIICGYSNNVFLKRVFRHIEPLVFLSINPLIKKEIKKVDIVLIPDAIATDSVIKWIKKHTSDKQRCLLHCSNRYNLIHNFSVEKARRIGFEIWSYSFDDCKNHILNYANQFQDKSSVLKASVKSDIKYDAVFIGYVKDRANSIQLIKETLEGYDMKTWFYVTGMVGLDGNVAECNDEINYNEYLKFVNESRCIIDIVSDTNKGLTFRPVEALFLRKKLITNYTDITKEPFYNPQNVFIFGVDDISKIREFVQSDYLDIPESIVNRYDSSFFFDTISQSRDNNGYN